MRQVTNANKQYYYACMFLNFYSLLQITQITDTFTFFLIPIQRNLCINTVPQINRKKVEGPSHIGKNICKP